MLLVFISILGCQLTLDNGEMGVTNIINIEVPIHIYSLIFQTFVVWKESYMNGICNQEIDYILVVCDVDGTYQWLGSYGKW